MTLPARLHTLISTDKRFVYIGGIDYHHCIDFLLIMLVNSYKKLPFYLLISNTIFWLII